MGFPIRKSADQRLFAPPHGLSQRTTSFIASQRQGIHRIPLRHLIALIINAHPSAEDRIVRTMRGRDRKTICFKHIREHCGHAMLTLVARPSTPRGIDKRSDMFPLHDDRQHAPTPCGAHANSVYPRIHRAKSANAPMPKAQHRRQSAAWWSQTGSNRRPHACKARALPTELWPHAGRIPRPLEKLRKNGGPGKT